MRTRRRRMNEEGSEKATSPISQKVKFMEEVDYKMEIDDGETNQKEVKPTDMNAEEEQKR
jgi:hypothetical protein